MGLELVGRHERTTQLACRVASCLTGHGEHERRGRAAEGCRSRARRTIERRAASRLVGGRGRLRDTLCGLPRLLRRPLSAQARDVRHAPADRIERPRQGLHARARTSFTKTTAVSRQRTSSPSSTGFSAPIRTRSSRSRGKTSKHSSTPSPRSRTHRHTRRSGGDSESSGRATGSGPTAIRSMPITRSGMGTWRVSSITTGSKGSKRLLHPRSHALSF
jgi:hypothetical protein